MEGTWIDIEAKDGSGSFRGYLSLPPTHEGPGLVVIQEIFGVNEVMRKLTERFAKHGFVALCPDLFWRQEREVELTDKSQDDWDRAFELMSGFDTDKGVADIQAAIDTLRANSGVKGGVGTVGYCLGGKLAYLSATRTDADAAVGYYGVGIADLLGEASRIKKPLLLHVANEDQFVDKEAQAAMHRGLDANPNVTLVDYPGRDHAFARPGGDHYHEADASRADKLTVEFLEKHLG